MDTEQITIKELSSSPYVFRKSQYRRRSLSEFDPKLGNDIQNLLKSAEMISLTGSELEKSQDARNEIPILGSLSNESSQQPMEQRKKNISDAIEWVRTELKLLKEQDKSLMRQFLDLRTSINQFRDELDPFDEAGFYVPKRSLSMMDHLNEEKRKSCFALARRLIEDIDTVDEMGLSDSDEDEEDTSKDAEEVHQNEESVIPRGREITYSVSTAAKGVRRPLSALAQGRTHTPLVTKDTHPVSSRPVSDSDKFSINNSILIGKSSAGIHQACLENTELDSEDTKL